MEIEQSKVPLYDKRYVIHLPDMRLNTHGNESDCSRRYFVLPQGIYDYGHVYPRCACGRKYVPVKHIEGCDKMCFWCVFNKK